MNDSLSPELNKLVVLQTDIKKGIDELDSGCYTILDDDFVETIINKANLTLMCSDQIKL